MLKLKNLLTEGNKFDDVYKDYGFEVEKKSGGLTYWAHYGSDISGHKNSYIRGELSGWTDGKKAAVGDDRGRESFSNPKAMAKWFEKNFKMKKESIHENQKKDASKAYVKFEDVYERFLIASVDMAKTAAKITNNPVDKKIILKGLTKHVVPFMELIKSWHKGQQDNPHIDEAYNHPIYGSDSSDYTVKKPFYVYVFTNQSKSTGQWSTAGPSGNKMISKKVSIKYQVQKGYQITNIPGGIYVINPQGKKAYEINHKKGGTGKPKDLEPRTSKIIDWSLFKRWIDK